MAILESNIQKFAKIIVLSILSFFYNKTALPQQHPLFSQYTFNAYLLNPAAAGAEGSTTINLTNRAQWVGVEGAPLNGTLSVQTRLLRQSGNKRKRSAKSRYTQSSRIGLAGGLYFDRAGLIDQTSTFISYAYHISTREYQFSLGASLSLMQFKVNTESLSDAEQQNNLLWNNNLLVYLPDFNIGTYYTTKNLFVGLSVLQLAQSSVHFQNYETNNFVIYRHFYLIGGYKFELNDRFVLEPSSYLKTSEEWRLQMDASVKLLYENKYWAGVAYRTGGAYIASVGCKIERLFIGYSFDYGTKGIINNSGGSHELMVALKLGDNYNRSKWLQHY